MPENTAIVAEPDNSNGVVIQATCMDFPKLHEEDRTLISTTMLMPVVSVLQLSSMFERRMPASSDGRSFPIFRGDVS